MTITGRTLGEEMDAYSPSFPQAIVRSISSPLSPNASLVVLKGNLVPQGCILKASAMSSGLKTHRGPACVFKNAEDLIKRIDDPHLDVTESSV
jgi:dihydroxy-acid dehydratase